MCALCSYVLPHFDLAYAFDTSLCLILMPHRSLSDYFYFRCIRIHPAFHSKPTIVFSRSAVSATMVKVKQFELIARSDPEKRNTHMFPSRCTRIMHKLSRDFGQSPCICDSSSFNFSKQSDNLVHVQMHRCMCVVVLLYRFQFEPSQKRNQSRCHRISNELF